MSNGYYNPSGVPATGSAGASEPIRSEFASISAAFSLLPTLAGNANAPVVVNGTGTALTTTSGTLELAGPFITSGAYSITLEASAAVVLTLPGANGTLATLGGANTWAAPNTFTGTILVDGVASFAGGFVAYGAGSTLAGGLTIVNGGLAVTGATTVDGALTTTGGIAGVTDGSNAAAGVVGEFLSNGASGITLPYNTTGNLLSVVLSAGDWDVWAQVQIVGNGATINGTTVAISNASATFGPVSGGWGTAAALSSANGSGITLAIMPTRLNVIGPTTIYVVYNGVWSGGTATANAFIGARRVR